MTNVLVAASDGITNEAWLERYVTRSLPEVSLHLYQFGEQRALTHVLSKLGLQAEVLPRSKPHERRSEIRRALAKADHLLLFWDGRSLNNLLFEARLGSTPTKIHAFEVTTVANKDRGDEFDVYIGRRTPWGNPFPVGKLDGQYERYEAIDLFKRHFEANILSDPSLKASLLHLRGLRLGCHCKPLACHGDVIAGYLNSLDPDDVEGRASRPEPLLGEEDQSGPDQLKVA